MKPRLQSSLADLCKLKNQIRIELNKIRPYKEPLYMDSHSKSCKKLFGEKNQTTSIVCPPAEKSVIKKVESKRHFEEHKLVNMDLNRFVEKRHFGKHYGDGVKINVSIKRKTSAYLNVKTDRSISPSHTSSNTSLLGIGENDRSLLQPSRSGIKINLEKRVSKAGLI